VLDLVPGMTDEASIRYRGEAALLAGAKDPERHYIESIMPDKIRVNLEYAAKATVWTDFIVILKTLSVLVARG
jgi:lipopolysaccharide/colanic/teichoic acid biosynthesis glycosyltransferase